MLFQQSLRQQKENKMKPEFDSMGIVNNATINAYHQFENDVRLALKNDSEEQLRQNINRAISTLESTFCPQQKEVNNNAS